MKRMEEMRARRALTCAWAQGSGKPEMDRKTFLVCLPRDVMSKTMSVMKTTVGTVQVTIFRGKKYNLSYVLLRVFPVTFQDCRPFLK